MPRFFARNRIVGVKNFSILLLGLYACGADTALGPEDQGPEQLQVDAGGTTVSAQNGNVSLTVPEGAVAVPRLCTTPTPKGWSIATSNRPTS